MTETETKPIKAAVYVRVSTRDQTTLNQEIALIEYCKKNNYEIFKIYKDEGISGAKTSRPYLDVMLDDMRNGLFGAVIVWKLDRLGRSTSHLLQVLEELKNKNVRLVAAAQNIDTDSPQGKFFFIIIGAVAELERDMITERVHLGLDRARKQGKKLGRQKGSKDKNDRKRLGYFERWSKRKAKTPVHTYGTKKNN
jgi:DNA invertase Pin-like site-specific DNA recombinase